MSDVSAGAMDLGDMLLWVAPEGRNKFYFLPLSPMIVQNRDGSDQVSLIDTGSLAFLQLTTHWAVPNTRLEAVRVDLEAQMNAPVILSFAPVEEVSASLIVGADSEILAASSTSGLAPFVAMFNLKIDGNTKAIIEAGLAGQTGQIVVQYQANLAFTQSLQVNLSGVLDADVSSDALRDALNEGLAMFVPPLRSQAALDSLISQAVQLLSTTEPIDASGRFSLRLSQSGFEQEPVLAKLDLGADRSALASFNAIMPSVFSP